MLIYLKLFQQNLYRTTVARRNCSPPHTYIQAYFAQKYAQDIKSSLNHISHQFYIPKQRGKENVKKGSHFVTILG